MPDDSSSSAKAETQSAQSWPPVMNDVIDAEAVLTQIHTMIAQIEQTIVRAKAHLTALAADASVLRQALTGTSVDLDASVLADLQAAQGLRIELVKAAQQSVLASQAAAKYLQARERFLIARREWTKRAGG